jgi:hypothetical protein
VVYLFKRKHESSSTLVVNELPTTAKRKEVRFQGAQCHDGYGKIWVFMKKKQTIPPVLPSSHSSRSCE